VNNTPHSGRQRDEQPFRVRGGTKKRGTKKSAQEARITGRKLSLLKQRQKRLEKLVLQTVVLGTGLGHGADPLQRGVATI